MIDKSQLESYKTFTDPHQIEKDYLQDLLLYNIYRITGSEFVFKGGTALSKVYHTDRFSEDIDFTLTRYGSADPEHAEKDDYAYIKDVLYKAASEIEYKNGYLSEPSANKFGTVSATLGIEGPRFTGRPSTLQHMNFEVSTGGSIRIKPKAAPIVPIYAGALNYVVTVMDATEILSEKIRASMNRSRHHRERDLYDMYVLLGKHFVPEKKVLKEKFEEVSRVFSKAEFERSILQIKNGWQDLKPMVQHTLEDYDFVSRYVVEKINKLDIG